jgi:hypothetical protein
MEEFGSIKAVRAAALDDFLSLSWLPDEVAKSLYDHLHQEHQPRLVKREGLHDD